MRARTLLIGAAMSVTGTTAVAEIVRPAAGVLDVLPGTQVRSVWIVADADTPLFGYSLDVNRTAAAGSTGSAAINSTDSNFYPPRNVYLAAGHDLDPFFTVMQGDGAGGVFLNTNAADLASVLPVAGVNDALAELVIDVSADAAGDFVFSLGPATALSDADGFAVAFTGQTLTLRVVPAPGAAVAVVGGTLVLCGCRHRR